MRPDVPRPRCCTGAEENALLTLHQRLWETGRVAHHAIDNTVEQQFHLSWNVTPIAGCSHDDGIGLLHHLQYSLGVVLSYRTFQLGATNHTTHTRFNVQVVGNPTNHQRRSDLHLQNAMWLKEHLF